VAVLSGIKRTGRGRCSQRQDTTGLVSPCSALSPSAGQRIEFFVEARTAAGGVSKGCSLIVAMEAQDRMEDESVFLAWRDLAFDACITS